MMLRIFPDHREIDADEAYDELAPTWRAPGNRPYVIVNMVSTVDGQARLGADTARLGGATDQRLLVKLREQVDCVFAGPETMRAERYKGPAARSETQARREARGLRPRPLMATVSRSGDLPWDVSVFQDTGIEVVIFSDTEFDARGALARITRVAGCDPGEMLRTLQDRFGVRSVLLEGGPRVNREFFAAGCVDELFLTVAPLIAGAAEPFPIVAGELPEELSLRLIGAMLEESELFLRYRVGRAAS